VSARNLIDFRVHPTEVCAGATGLHAGCCSELPVPLLCCPIRHNVGQRRGTGTSSRVVVGQELRRARSGRISRWSSAGNALRGVPWHRPPLTVALGTPRRAFLKGFRRTKPGIPLGGPDSLLSECRRHKRQFRGPLAAAPCAIASYRGHPSSSYLVATSRKRFNKGLAEVRQPEKGPYSGGVRRDVLATMPPDRSRPPSLL
jgi:hypothetical protein